MKDHIAPIAFVAVLLFAAWCRQKDLDRAWAEAAKEGPAAEQALADQLRDEEPDQEYPDAGSF